MTVRFVGNSREDHAGRFDVVGSVLSALAIGGLVLGIHEGPEQGWTDALTLVGPVVGVLALAGFVVWELRVPTRSSTCACSATAASPPGSVTLLIVFAVLMGIFLVLIQFLQAVVGYSALRAAAGPAADGGGDDAALDGGADDRQADRAAHDAADRRGPFAGGLALLAMMVSVEGGYWSILPGLLVLGVGIGLLMSPVDDGDHRVAARGASGRGLGAQRHGARVRRCRRHRPARIGAQRRLPLVGERLDRRSPARAGAPGRGGDRLGLRQQPASSGRRAPQVLDAARHALVDGWQLSMWVGVAMAAAVFLFLAVRGPARRTSEPGRVDSTSSTSVDRASRAGRRPRRLSSTATGRGLASPRWRSTGRCRPSWWRGRRCRAARWSSSSGYAAWCRRPARRPATSTPTSSRRPTSIPANG